MAKSRSDRSPPVPDHDELRETVERLTDRVQILTQAVDELFIELQWRNNELRDRQPAPPPFVLRSMPADPTTDDWHLNRVSPEEIERLRCEVSPPADDDLTPPLPTYPPPSARDDLRQMLAATILLVSDACPEELAEVHDRLLDWAWRELDWDRLTATRRTRSRFGSVNRRINPAWASRRVQRDHCLRCRAVGFCSSHSDGW